MRGSELRPSSSRRWRSRPSQLWVPNADLPALAPDGAGGGYFVLKNSWGEGRADCGYVYVPYDYLLEHGRSLTTVHVL